MLVLVEGSFLVLEELLDLLDDPFLLREASILEALKSGEASDVKVPLDFAGGQPVHPTLLVFPDVIGHLLDSCDRFGLPDF